MDLQEMAAQLRKPEGEAGHQVAAVMNKGNRLINQWAIEALELAADDTVLEIGMGNGAFAKDVLSVHSTIQYCGADYSSSMVEEATLLNDSFVQEGRAVFLEADAALLPFQTSAFSKILIVNTIYFWDDAKPPIAEIARVLKPGGRAVIAIRTKETMDQMPFTQFGFNKYDLQSLIVLLSKSLTIVDAFEKSEPSYDFNGQQLLLTNAFVVCTKGGMP